MAISLAACASSTPLEAARPTLPAPPASCVGAPLPAATLGKDLRVFALQNRAAAIDANRGVENCQQFIAEQRRDFSAP